jgi:hypothetical protein
MSSVEMPSLPLAATPRLPRTWYFWGSTVFGLLAHGAMVLAQMLALVVALIRYGGADPEAALSRSRYRRVRGARIPVSGLVEIVSRPDRRHSADIGSLDALAHAV